LLEELLAFVEMLAGVLVELVQGPGK